MDALEPRSSAPLRENLALHAKQFQDCNDEDGAVPVRALFASGKG
jgi:hypothetical protein